MKHPLSGLIAGTVFALFSLSAAANEQDAIGSFEIARFAVQGNTLLSEQAVNTLLTPYTGKGRNFGHVQMALEALESAYHKHGYNIVQVVLPEQELNQGVVTLRVVETRLGKVRVEGNRHFDEANIRRSVPGLQEGQSPNIGDVSSSVKLVNENPAKKVTLQLQSSEGDDVNATLKVVDDKPWKIGASLDNSGSDATGKTYLTTQYQHANIADRDHVMSLQYITTVEKPSQVNVYGVGYHIPLYGIGDSLDLFATYSDVDSRVIFNVVNVQASGKGTMYGIRYNHNLRRNGGYESKLIYGVDYKDSRYNSNYSSPGNFQFRSSQDITIHPLSIAYAGAWIYAQSEVNFGLTAIHNLPGGDRGSNTASDPRHDASFDILRYNAGYARALPNDWQMRVSLAGQYSPDTLVLVPGERFGAGGATTVRGFQERELSSDSGHFLSAEVYTPNLCAGITQITAHCRALAFYDVANVRQNKPIGDDYTTASIASIGLGWRMSIDKHMALQMDAARVLDAGPTEGKGDSRMHVKLAVTY